jgi:hypothetical protein
MKNKITLPIISAAVAALNCGHSNVLLSRAYEQHMKKEASFLPFQGRKATGL